MKDLSDMSMFELACEMNSLTKQINDMVMQYNRVVSEIKSRNDKLKDDPNLEPKVLRKELGYDRFKTNRQWEKLYTR